MHMPKVIANVSNTLRTVAAPCERAVAHEKVCACRHVAAMASEEEEDVIRGAANRKYEVAFDPLDGSSNLDTQLPTGSIFAIFEHAPLLNTSPAWSASGAGQRRGTTKWLVGRSWLELVSAFYPLSFSLGHRLALAEPA